MNVKESNYKALIKTYDEKRNKAHRELIQRKQEIYQKLPEIEYIDKELNRSGISLVRRISSEPNVLEKYYKRTNELKKKKEDLLRKYGYPANYLESKFECDKCQDVGYLEDGTRCTCFQQGLIDLAYEQSNIKSILKIENFGSFSSSYYSDSQDQSYNRSPRQNIDKIKQVVWELLDNFETEPMHLFMYGQTGLGKTFMCNCIAKVLLDNGCIVLYFTSPQLFKKIDESRFQNKKYNQDISLSEVDLNALYEVDLLIIDDLGSEFMTEAHQSDLFNIINTRYLNQKSTIISTNCTLTQLSHIYSDRITSRLIGLYTRLHFIGDDIRKQKQYHYQLQKST